jgi:release factor glutamine methyltransferase
MTTTATARPRSRPSDHFRLPDMAFRLPGVYRPQADTRMLATVLMRTPTPPRARVLDVCAGTGALAVTAAMLGKGAVTALDISRRAVLSTRLNAWHRGLSVRVSRMSFMDFRSTEPFDLVLANPPYVPCGSAGRPVGADRSWDAGPDGRALLDPLCAGAPDLLSASGCLLLVQSEVSGVDVSLARLRAAGLRARVVTHRRVPFGPVMSARAAYLEWAGLIAPGQRHESLVVIRADRG